jgi:hypothetical protein
MWDVRAVENGTKINQRQNTLILAMVNASMKGTLHITSNFNREPNGNIRDTVAPGKECKTKTSHLLFCPGCKNTTSHKNGNVQQICD